MALYDAFVSYSHAKDKPIAAALQSVVQKLGKPWYRRRALRVFRDDTSLSATPTLWPSIEQALAQSRYFILLASPDAAASKWVNKEVAYWLEHKSVDALLLAVTEGELVWNEAIGDFIRQEDTPLPPVLAGRFMTEPKWVDLRVYRRPFQRAARFTELAADFVATVRGIPKDDLLSQEVHQQRKTLTLAWSAAGMLLTLVIVAAGASVFAFRAQEDALRAERQAIAERDKTARNFNLAKRAADDVVFRLAQDLRDVQGMQVETVRKILDTAQALIDELLRAAPESLELLRSKAAMLAEFSKTYLAAGDLAHGRSSAAESVAIARRLLTADPNNIRRQADLAAGLDALGVALTATGESAGALAAHEEGLAFARRVAAADPTESRWRYFLCLSLQKLGDLRRNAHDVAGARLAYEESLAIIRALAATDPNNFEWQDNLSSSLDRIGVLKFDAEDYAGALAAFRETLSIARKVAASRPNDAWMRNSLSLCLNHVGRASVKIGDREGARAAYQEAVAIMRALAATDPNNVEWQTSLARNLSNASEVSAPPGARAELLEALAIFDALARKGKLRPEDRDRPQQLRDRLAKLQAESANAR